MLTRRSFAAVVGSIPLVGLIPAAKAKPRIFYPTKRFVYDPTTKGMSCEINIDSINISKWSEKDKRMYTTNCNTFEFGKVYDGLFELGQFKVYPSNNRITSIEEISFTLCPHSSNEESIGKLVNSVVDNHFSKLYLFFNHDRTKSSFLAFGPGWKVNFGEDWPDFAKA